MYSTPIASFSLRKRYRKMDPESVTLKARDVKPYHYGEENTRVRVTLADRNPFSNEDKKP